jgi:cell division inhibitor SepF
MRDTDPDMVRRLIDFASGLTYGLDGTMSKIAEGVILVLPHGMSLGRSEMQRLSELGFYALDDA